jgi:hypothetical protein
MTASLKAKIWPWHFVNMRKFQLSNCEVQLQYCSSSELLINMYYCINMTLKMLSNWRVMGKNIWHWFVFRQEKACEKIPIYCAIILGDHHPTIDLFNFCVRPVILNITKMVHGEVNEYTISMNGCDATSKESVFLWNSNWATQYDRHSALCKVYLIHHILKIMISSLIFLSVLETVTHLYHQRLIPILPAQWHPITWIPKKT